MAAKNKKKHSFLIHIKPRSRCHFHTINYARALSRVQSNLFYSFIPLNGNLEILANGATKQLVFVNKKLKNILGQSTIYHDSSQGTTLPLAGLSKEENVTREKKLHAPTRCRRVGHCRLKHLGSDPIHPSPTTPPPPPLKTHGTWNLPVGSFRTFSFQKK